ncbi:High-affinity glucose transporter, putative [Candida maltosa Xu316]|uniref:High-affinity glucose transporter, putative n=1 Tax=Candida maltosa (strain Xu316) TaxID=1245528 RepID=M3K2C9_CANMX|nr:High-affinity glucose transporter, putative [Candida maltosa Xu316]
MELYSYQSVRHTNLFATLYREPTKIEINLLKASNFLGAIGSIIGGEVSEHFGFIRSMESLSVVWIIGIIFTFISDTITMLMMGKIINGVAIGMSFITIPIYQYEIIPNKNRGRILSIFIFSCSLGNVFIYIIRLISERFLNESKYSRLHWAIEIIPLIIAATFIVFIPESPKWLATNSEWQTAADVLESIEIKNSSPVEKKKTKEERIRLGDKHYVIKKYSTGVCIKSCSINGLFGKKYIKEVCMGIVLLFFVDFTSISKILESLDYICESCFIVGDNLKTVTVFQLVMRVLFTAAPIMILDMMRRKDVLVFGMFLTTVVMIIYMIVFLGFSVKLPDVKHPDADWFIKVNFFDEKASLVLALTVFLDVVYYSMLVPTCWLYIIENFSSSSRIKGWVVITSLHWMFEACTSLAFPFLLEKLGGWLFFIVTFICLAGSFFTTQLEETKGKFDFDPEYIMTDDRGDVSEDKTITAQPVQMKSLKDNASLNSATSGSKNGHSERQNLESKPSIKSIPIVHPWEVSYGKSKNEKSNSGTNPTGNSSGVNKNLLDAYARL